MPALERPNIILCLFDSLSAVGGQISDEPFRLSTLPTLSKLCSASACFNKAYTPCPESSPARASLFTGLDPCVHSLWTNGVTLPDHEQTFPQRLSQAGYTNYLAGRYQLSGVSRWTTEQARRGEYHRMDWAHGPLHRSRQNAYLEWLQKKAPDHYSNIFASQANPDNTVVTQQQREALAAMPDALSFNHWVGESITRWIDSQSADQPFLAIAGFSVGNMLGGQPHPATDLETLNELALKQADGAIGGIMNCLESCHRSKDTVVIVTAARGNTKSLDSNQALADCTLNEQAIRVPLIIHGNAFEPRTLDDLVSTMDIAPTILSLANVPCGPRVQGESLLTAIDGTRNHKNWCMSRIRQSLPSGERNWQTALIAKNMKLVIEHGEQESNKRMHNLDTDPLEQNNLVGSEDTAPQLEQLIDQMIDARCALEDRTEPRIAEF